MTGKEEFIAIYKRCISRYGADRLLEWLENESDFFVAPASTKYHLNRAGGLVEHSIHVYRRLYDLCNYEADDEAGDYIRPSDETIAICGLLHDVCKANFYKIEMRNRKNEATGQWEKVPVYEIDDQFPYGHGEKSVEIVSRFITLTDEEKMAIRWHMGGFDDSVKAGARYLSKAYEMYPVAMLTHLADMQATYLDEVERK